MNLRILLVEDEKSLSETIRLNLELEGYTVVTAGDGRSAVKIFKQERFNLIILDVMLPEMDGFTVCEIIRLENPDIPVLFLTAKNSSEDKIKGLKLGADDYLVKPFNLEELLLRVQILLKRSVQMQDKVKHIEVYTFDGFNINFDQREIKTPKKQVIPLTKKEALLLKLLVERKNEVISREYILETVWGYDIYPSTRTIDNFMVTFRKYFEKDPSNPRHFMSVRAVGYKFVE
jgi:two-component system alkaline phosphatase synthesis response regulator PhoP